MSKKTAKKSTTQSTKRVRSKTPFRQKPPVPASERRKRTYKGPGNESVTKRS